MSQPTSVSKPTHTHTIWRQRPLNKMQRLVGVFIPKADIKLFKFVVKHKLYHMHYWDDELRLTVPLGNKIPEKALADLGALMAIERLDKYWEFVTRVLTEDPLKVDPRVYNIK
ncbi:hypothetical protein IWW34DRAFT_791340 [Fusarium oxysporum f. sp. albedinis]|nr:hypothetical protein IWW34DRAFT_791340 [Fusarium oxysporum f. sp. albedinis]KAK2472807.1 hypothetical protein H9L39_14982 [Fusarium oxysporum f. sp. albedinis]